MWTAKTTDRDSQQYCHCRVFDGPDPVSYRDVISLWISDAAFRDWFSRLLSDSPMIAFRWETPPISRSNIDRDFEFVLLPSDSLQRPPDRTAFSQHFDQCDGAEFATFENLGGDAMLIVPCPTSETADYVHLASFLRTAPQAQVDALWKATGRAAMDRLSDRRFWLSTAGMGVAWLHMRLDNRPKYYGHLPYRNE